MKTENMPTENRALNAKLLLLIAKQRKKLFSMNSNLKICEEQAKRREETLNNLLDFQKKQTDYYSGYEKEYWEIKKKYLDCLEKTYYLKQEIKGFEEDIQSLYAERDSLEKSKKALIKQIKKL
jgi:chromosome segregation ATPase